MFQRDRGDEGQGNHLAVVLEQRLDVAVEQLGGGQRAALLKPGSPRVHGLPIIANPAPRPIGQLLSQGGQLAANPVALPIPRQQVERQHRGDEQQQGQGDGQEAGAPDGPGAAEE